MRADAKANQVVIAMAKAIEATFAKGDWLELGLLTDTDNLIRNHPRLLRSLDWGDPDYSGCVIDVLPRVLGDTGRPTKSAANRYLNLAIVEDKVGLEGWLAEHERGLHSALYAGDGQHSGGDLELTERVLSGPGDDQPRAGHQRVVARRYMVLLSSSAKNEFARAN